MVSTKGQSTVDLKRVFLFPDAYKALNHLGSQKMREMLGGKGAGLAEMTSSGVNVPPGLTITTSV